MKTLLIAAFLLFTIAGLSQVPATKVLVADETWIIPSGKTSFRIVTCNDSISNLIAKQLPGVTKFTAITKQDRFGRYWEHSYYFLNKEWNDIVKFIKRL